MLPAKFVGKSICSKRRQTRRNKSSRRNRARVTRRR